MTEISQKDEATIFGNYLLNRIPNTAVRSLYENIIQSSGIPISGNEEKLFRFALKNAWSIGLIDSALALLNPHHELRRRLYLMYALLEATPEYADHFLPKQRNPFYLFVILFSGCRAIVKTIIGVLLVKLIA